jgi:hypothetical protein
MQIAPRMVVGATYTNAVVRISDIQLERGSARTAYQANFSQYNITEAGVADCYSLRTDGVDDWMQTNAFAWGSDEVTAVAGVQKVSDDARGMFLEFGTGGAPNFQINVPSANGEPNYSVGSGGSTVVFAAAANSYPAPGNAVLTLAANITADTLILRRNGIQIATSSDDQGTGDYGTYPLFFFRRGGTTLPFNGDDFQSIGIARNLSASELAQIEAYMTQRTSA